MGKEDMRYWGRFETLKTVITREGLTEVTCDGRTERKKSVGAACTDGLERCVLGQAD